MTTRDKIHSIAEKHLEELETAEEKEALIHLDPTELKERLRYYDQRVDDL